tara:strand:+ start:194 stop:919 length:726 start_codon:yes stop_codon:yes gene_type:complete
LNTVDKTEIEKFSKLAKDWWNPKGKFKPLHIFNPTRIKFIKEKLISYFNLRPDVHEPLQKINILDIGCGGGLLSEPLQRLGASVTGIDASKNNIEVAKLHAKEMSLNINYIHCSPENFKTEKKFSVVLAMEVVEHVADVDLFIENCSKLLEKDGIMFVATINKNLKSYFYAIIGAEYILRYLPIGTHDWNKFLTPAELENIAINKKFLIDEVVGMKFNPFLKSWKISSDPSVNYISTFLKN